MEDGWTRPLRLTALVFPSELSGTTSQLDTCLRTGSGEVVASASVPRIWTHSCSASRPRASDLPWKWVRRCLSFGPMPS